MNEFDNIINSVTEKAYSIAQQRVYEIAQGIENHLHGPQVDDAIMAGNRNVAFALRTANVTVIQKSNTEYAIELTYNNDNSVVKYNTEDVDDDMKFYFYESKNYVCG